MPTPRAGYHLKDGTRIPGTTTICSRFKDSGGLIVWANREGLAGRDMRESRDQAADVGTHIHAMVEAHINGTPLPEYPDHFTKQQCAQAEEGYRAFTRWERQSRLVVVEQEISLVSEQHKYGGTPDAIGMVEDELTLLDWKSGNAIYADALIQVAAYLHLYEEIHPDRPLVGGIHIVRFGKDGGEFMHHAYPATHPKILIAWEQFLLFRQAYDNDQRLRK